MIPDIFSTAVGHEFCLSKKVSRWNGCWPLAAGLKLLAASRKPCGEHHSRFFSFSRKLVRRGGFAPFAKIRVKTRVSGFLVQGSTRQDKLRSRLPLSPKPPLLQNILHPFF
ncbi:MAG TPA: hypothetical protein PK198_14440, partial [Saprospiraceae bacterium]|nr:hypothetical protein [Saprospiraceae bacterium]